MNSAKVGLAAKKTTKPVSKPTTAVGNKPSTTLAASKAGKKVETDGLISSKTKDADLLIKEAEAKIREIENRSKETVSKVSLSEHTAAMNISIAETERSYQSKLDTQKKSISKMKMELQTLRDENNKLKLTVEEKDKLLKELQTKFPANNEGFLAKRSYLLKAKIVKQEKHIVILESQIRNMKGIYTEIFSQIESTLSMLSAYQGKEFSQFSRETGKVDDVIDSLRMCQARLPDLRSLGRYEYGSKLHKDNFIAFEKEERDDDDDAGNRIIERSDLHSRADLEESLIGILEMVETLKEQLGGEKYTNTLVNLGHLSRRVAEFMLTEGFEVRKIKKVFGRKEKNSLIQKNIALFEHLLRNLHENADVLKRFEQSVENISKELVSTKGREDVEGCIDRYLRNLDEEKRVKIMKNRDVGGLLETLKETSKIEKYINESQRVILSLFAAKAFGEIEKLREFVEERLGQTLSLIQAEIYEPFRSMFTIFKNYEGQGNEIAVGINILGVMGMAGDRMMYTFDKVFSTAKELKQSKNDGQNLGLRVLIEGFENKVKQSMQNLAN